MSSGGVSSHKSLLWYSCVLLRVEEAIGELGHFFPLGRKASIVFE